MFYSFSLFVFVASYVIRAESNPILTTKELGTDHPGEHEYPNYDGWYNNIAIPRLGSADQPLIRRTPAAYEDGVYDPARQKGPNPFIVSDRVMKGDIGEPSAVKRSAFLVFFGQQVVEEILDAQRAGCPPEYHNIHFKGAENTEAYMNAKPINSTTPSYLIKEMPLPRTRYAQNTGFSPHNPRQQLNEITPWIDGTLMYGPNKAFADALRSFTDGKLTEGPGEEKFEVDGKEIIPDKELFESCDKKKYFGCYPANNRKHRLPIVNPPPADIQRQNVTGLERLRNVDRLWVAGNPRTNENPFLLSFAVVWFRWHNKLAEDIKNAHSSLSDEQIFNLARIYTIATYQKMVMYDWLPSWLDLDQKLPAFLGTNGKGTDFGNVDGSRIPKYTGYNPSVDPQVSHVFQSAAMRYGHTLVPPGVYKRPVTTSDWKYCVNDNLRNASDAQKANVKEEFKKDTIRTCNSYFAGQEFIRSAGGIEPILYGMASQITEREDVVVTPDLRGFVFGPLEFSRRDLMAINIQRGRDHGIPDYCTVRKWYQLDVPKDCKFTGVNRTLDCARFINSENDTRGMNVCELYDYDLSKMDLWPAGLSETRDAPGPTFTSIILDQFLRIRDADRFWFENENNGLFNAAAVEWIKRITIRDVIIAVTNITEDMLQPNLFRVEGLKFCPAGSPPQLNVDRLEECSPVCTYDYFENSPIAYILSLIALIVIGIMTAGLVIFLGQRRIASEANSSGGARAATAGGRKASERQSNDIQGEEFVGSVGGWRKVVVKVKPEKRHLVVRAGGRVARLIDMTKEDPSKKILFRLPIKDQRLLCIKFAATYDLFLRLPSSEEQNEAIRKVEDFLGTCGIGWDREVMKEFDMFNQCLVKEDRQRLVESFITTVYQQAFSYDTNLAAAAAIGSPLMTGPRATGTQTKRHHNILETELTPAEFADAFGLSPDSDFTRNLFDFADKNKSGTIQFQEFLDVMLQFAKGDATAKAKLLFNMHDFDQDGFLSLTDFQKMLKSMLDLASKDVTENVENIAQTILKENHLENKDKLTFDDFQKILKDYEYEIGAAQVGKLAKEDKTNARGTAITRGRHTIVRHINELSGQDANQNEQSVDGKQVPVHKQIKVQTKKNQEPSSAQQERQIRVLRYIDNNRWKIFWLILWTLVTIGIFAERAYYYSIEREHAGLRRIAGYGVTITRGAASGMMFTYCCMLVTMCRNTITFLRETILHRFVPFDSHLDMHKYISAWALFFTVMHVIGHCINFYHIATQTGGDLSCLFRDFFHSQHELPKFQYWLWGTITGFTGVVLTVIVFIIYAFATQFARRYVFQWFWTTHKLYIFLIIFMLLHGSGRLVQPPFTHLFFIGPIILFTLDKVISISRKKTEIAVVRADLLPSEVTGLVFKRPKDFQYRAGQWVKIASIALSDNEYHPFTLSSAPHEDHLSLHIRAVGPWTKNLRKTYDKQVLGKHHYPKIFLDGPYGEGHQDWYKFDVAILVGGGIGVTPFASILKDIIHRSKTGQKIFCKKVYFCWVTRSQKQYEWLVDVIREVEAEDKMNVVSVHIFLTQLFSKFDLRTTMLYICERHFQKINGRSLFTGLRALTHFGRPDFHSFFTSLANIHQDISKIGVFSCGPPAMTRSVDEAASAMEQYKDAPAFLHHFENF